jgi:hypothetical protein
MSATDDPFSARTSFKEVEQTILDKNDQRKESPTPEEKHHETQSHISQFAYGFDSHSKRRRHGSG